MTRVSDADTTVRARPATGTAAAPDLGLLQAFIVVVVVGAGLSAAARESAVALLVAVAVVQALLAAAWVLGTSMPGRWGGLIIGALASGGADVAVSVRPHDRLGVLLTVLGLTVPVIFVHQLARGAARVQVVASMGAVALLAIAEVALAALLQTRHEFTPSDTGGAVAAAAVAAVGAALAIGFIVDLVLPSPRFDAEVRRGLTALVVSAAAGAAVAVAMLHDQTRVPVSNFSDGRSAFLGAALGVLAGLLSVACSFVMHTTPVPTSVAARLRPVITAVLPLALLAPVAFLLCLAIRS